MSSLYSLNQPVHQPCLEQALRQQQSWMMIVSLILICGVNGWLLYQTGHPSEYSLLSTVQFKVVSAVYIWHCLGGLAILYSPVVSIYSR